MQYNIVKICKFDGSEREAKTKRMQVGEPKKNQKPKIESLSIEEPENWVKDIRVNGNGVNCPIHQFTIHHCHPTVFASAFTYDGDITYSQRRDDANVSNANVPDGGNDFLI
uniref:Uncharacterized protein n=1 Tax=Romanomermis culicivorax TaxID=13658 RepID=A0A915HYY1_ROMCU